MCTEKSFAPSNIVTKWEEINFKLFEKYVKRLQKRISKAYQQDDIRKLKALCNLLIHSFYAKALAVRIVTTRTGSNTPGIDGIIWSTPEQKWNAITELRCIGYKYNTHIRVYKDKPNGSKRPLDIPTMKDRTMQTLFKFVLEPIAEINADTHSYGFRKGLSTREAITRCKEVWIENPSHIWVLEADITSFFNSISHKWLMDNIPMDVIHKDKRILKQFITSGYIEGNVFHSTDKGIPQGGSLSPVLCNMVMNGLETRLSSIDVNYIRYADDFVVTSSSRELLLSTVIPIITEFLDERGLELSDEKTEITNVTDGIKFLGWKLKKMGEEIIITPSNGNFRKLLLKLRDIVIEPKYTTYEQVQPILEQSINQWMNYHKEVVTPTSLDTARDYTCSCISKWTKDDILVKFVGTLFSYES